MTATNHGLFGSTLAIILQKYPIIAIAIAPCSHFLLDMIPHFGDKHLSLKSKKFFRILFADMTLAVASTLLIAWLWPDVAPLVVVCAFLAASPDLMWLYYEYIHPTPQKKWGKIAKFHSWIQWSQTPKGVIYEGMWFTAFFGTLIFLGVS